MSNQFEEWLSLKYGPPVTAKTAEEIDGVIDMSTGLKVIDLDEYGNIVLFREFDPKGNS